MNPEEKRCERVPFRLSEADPAKFCLLPQETMKKTKALLARLESLKTVNEETGEGYITFEALQERRLPAGT